MYYKVIFYNAENELRNLKLDEDTVKNDRNS